MGGIGAATTASALGAGPLIIGGATATGILGGELVKGNEDLKEAKQTIEAISKGDVEALVSAGLGKQKGLMESALDSLYDFIKICLVLLILWNLVPLAYARFIHRKHINGNPKKTTE